MSANDCDTQPSSGDGCIRRRPRNIEKWDRTVAKVKRTQRKEYTQQERKRASYDPQAHNVERLVSEELKDSFISVKEECTFEKNAPGIEIQKVYTMNQNPDLQCIKEEPGIRKECVDEKEIEFGEVQYSSETNRKQNKQFEECGLQSSVNVKEELIGLRMNESSIGAIDQAMVKCMNDEDIAEEKPTIKEEPLDEKDMEISSSLGTTQSERNQKPLESGAETKVKYPLHVNCVLTTMAEWSDDNVLLFISYYKEKSLLWNPKHPSHFDKALRSDAWVDIAMKMGRTVEECKKKMTYLLSAMRREKAKMKKSIGTGNGADNVYKSTWFACKSMQFLWEKDKPRETTSTIHVREIAGSEEQEHNIAESVDDQFDLPTIHTNTTESTPISSSQSGSRKKVLDQCPDTAFEILMSCASSHDEAQDFANFSAKKLRKYDSVTRSAVQHAIMGIFLNADMGLYERQPAYSYSGPSNPYGLQSVAEPPFPVVNMPSVAHYSHSPSPFDTCTTSSTTPQPTEQCMFSSTSSEDEFSVQELI